jgi:hypothetical protein
MPETLHVITRERHLHKKWQRPTGYGFAASINLAPVGAPEIAHAGRAFPLAFVDMEDGATLVALFSLHRDRNLFVAPDGRWLASHVPAALQNFPFSLGRQADGKFALCVNEASGLIRDTAVGEHGFPFFASDGTPTRETQAIADSLTRARRSLDVVRNAVAALATRGLLEPWPVVAKEETGDRRIGGLKRINEAALNAAGADDLVALRDCGALATAYCQLFSMGNISVLGSLAGAQDRAKRQRMAIPANSFIPEDDGNLKIDWSTFLKDE